METYEFEGKTDHDAIENACRKLSLKKDQMDIVILEPGSAGIFGLVGGRKAKIKVTIKREIPEAVEEAPKEEPQEKPAQSSAEPKDVPPSTESETTVPENREEEIAIAKEALENILALIPMEGITITGELEDGSVKLNIEGDKTGLLIGRKGKTLDALQFIVNKIVNKSLEKRSRVIIDSENYRLRRQEFLIQMALKMGDKAKKIKRPVATNLLNPHDRRIVHLALRDDEELGTKGKGEGILKKVVIIPKKYNSSRASRAH
ncbi:MAG TPA: RNA-binding cell elongation regulator Jag/EloR [Desulfobacteria bacterium]|nr:RNA-binding cell elongation regulator Jag/EloR [Desulfobacteria bacterium]